MSLFDAIRFRWEALTRPRIHERELAEEMDFHLSLESMQRETAARGALSPDDARRLARRHFGNTTYYGEESRLEVGLGMMDTVRQDARFALRMLRRSPVFTVVTVATLAIGIGANTAIFSAVNALLLRPLPFPQPARLMSVGLTLPPRGSEPARADIPWSYPKFELLRSGQRVFSSVSLWLPSEFTIRVEDEAVREAGEIVDAGFFTTLGVRPQLGRGFVPDDERAGAPRTVVISDGFWQRLFNADPQALGKSLSIDGVPYTIIGVAPPSFGGMSGHIKFWFPTLAAPLSWPEAIKSPGNHSFFAIGRLADGVAAQQAAAVVAQVGARVNEAFPDPRPGLTWGATATTLDATRLSGETRTALVVMFGSVGLLLLVACSNVANLFLARAFGRAREIAVRLAIGASRARLVRQLVVESLLLSALGGIASVLVAVVGVKALVQAQPTIPLGWQSGSGINMSSMQPIQLDKAALLFTGAMVVITGLLFGLVPALQSTRPSLSEGLKSDGATSGVRGRSATRGRLNPRLVLTVVEIAVAVVLLAGCGVVVRSFAHLAGVRPGFDPQNVLSMRLNRSPAWSRDSIERFYDVALERIAQLPGVTNVALADCPPVSGGCYPNEPVFLHDRPAEKGREPIAGVHHITGDWLTAMRVPLLSGRSFTAADGARARRVVLVSETAARTFWPGQDPIGKVIGGGSNDTVHVIGVVADIRFRSLELPPTADVYLPYHQTRLSQRMMLFIRTQGDPYSLVLPVRRALREVAPGFPVYDVKTMDSRLADVMAYARFSMTLLGIFAALALALATMGAYAIISFTVEQRTREIGLRVALGATARDITGMVVGQGMRLAAIGGAIGLAGALLSTRVLRSQLYGVEPNDPATMVTITIVLAAAVLAATWIPARRAASVDAVRALHH